MSTITRIVQSGMCTGCRACNICEHIRFQPGPLGFDVPIPNATCTRCGQCVKACIYDPEREDDDE